VNESQKNNPTSVGVPVQAKGILARLVGEEAVAHDAATTSTHALGPVAAAVFAAVDGHRDSALLGDARPLNVRGPSGSTRVAPESLGAVEHRICPVGLVVVTHHDPDVTWNPPSRVTAGVVIPLTDNSVAAQLAPSRVLDHLTEVARTRPGNADRTTRRRSFCRRCDPR